MLLTAGVRHTAAAADRRSARSRRCRSRSVPLVTRILRALRAQGVTEAVLNLHYRPETLAAVVGDGGDADIKVRYSWEPTILGRAGGPRLALPLIASDPFLLVNGDTLSNVDYRGHVASIRTPARSSRSR